MMIARLHSISLSAFACPVYDIGRRESFEALGKIWLKEVELYSTYPNAVKLLVGNKVDTVNREVSFEEARDFARERNTLFIECSAKTKKGIEDAFAEVVTKVKLHLNYATLSCCYTDIDSLGDVDIAELLLS